nr:potassium transporter TrkG [Brevibacillus migulae]
MPFFDRKRKSNSVQMIVFLYVGMIFLATLLLKLPIFHNPGVSLSWIDSLFTAASAISVTGLSVIQIHHIFNQWGIFFLTLLFQVGGIGIMTLGAFVWVVLGKNIGLEQRKRIAADNNRQTLAGLVNLIINVLVLTLYIELIGTILLGTYFVWAGYHQEWHTAFYYGYFVSVSAFTNAGFDIYGNSLINFAQDYFVQIVNMILITCGAIGFPVLIELQSYVHHRRNKMKFSFSLFTKITTITFFSLVAIGTLFFYLFERDLFLQDKSWHEAFFYALFHSVSSRSGGLVTMDLSLLSAPTMVLLSGFMFIGASPNSVGGGIRTTTFFVLAATMFAYMRGHKRVKVFRKELMDDDINRSFMVFFFSICLVFTAVILFIWTEDLPLQHVLFEICSAFGTTGLSSGITSEIGAAGKLILIGMMIIGRIGIINLLLFAKKDGRPSSVAYPKERLIIG